MFFTQFDIMRKTYFIKIRCFILIAFACGVVTGCINTEGTLKIKGIVADECTKKGIPWNNIIIQGVVAADDKSETYEAGQFSTDSSGLFTYSFRKIKDAYSYNFCFIGSTDYPVTIKTMSISGLVKNAKYLSFSLSKLVDLTIKINRKSKTPVCDTLHLYWESDGIYGGSLFPYKIDNYIKKDNTFGLQSDRYLVWIGGKVNSTIRTKVFADKKTELSWELYRNGRRKEFTDTITCKRDFANIVYFSY
jgi:hypothetical protein